MVSLDRSPVRIGPLRLVIAGVAAVVLTLVLLLLMATESHAAGNIEPMQFNVEEEFTLQLNETGDAQCIDVLKYDRAFFNTQGFTFENYPFLLERRFRDYADIREITDFNYKIDRPDDAITLSFRSFGKAYNEGDYWIVYGFSNEPRFTINDKLVFESASTVNNEFTLWQDLAFKTTTYLALPAQATDVQYNADKNAVTYKLAYVPPSGLGGNVFQRNSLVFIPLFAVVLAGSIAVVVLLVLRERRSTAVPVTSAGASPAPIVFVATERVPTETVLAPVGALPEPALPEEEESAAEEPAPRPLPSAPPAPAGPEAHEVDERPARFCGFCGVRIPSEEYRFCPHCGREIG